MKNIKKLTSLLLALVMVMAMTLSVSAANVTIGEDTKGLLTGHTFKAYQIFDADYADGKLTNIEWGTGIKVEEFVGKLVNLGYTGLIATGEDASTAEDVAKAIVAANTDSEKANKIAQAAYECKATGIDVKFGEETNLADGYYVIVDETASTGDVAINAALLEIVGDEEVEINVKTDKPSIEKKVKENVKETPDDEEYGDGYNDVADYNIGDKVPFAFYSKAPDMTNYDSYKYTIHDKMSAGLTFNKDSVVVTIGENVLKDGQYTVVTEGLHAADCTFEIRIADLKTVAGNGDDIRVDFTATLNANAEIGLSGNPNTVKLTYSNNPNDDNSEGTTPDDTVIVFTYELDVTKVDGANTEKKLENAEFILMNEDKTKAAKVENGKFAGWVDEKEATTLVSDANGNFGVAGLDDGTYYLKETKAPAGYNLLKNPIEVVVKTTTSNGQTWTDGKATSALTKIDVTADGKPGVGDLETGEAEIKVANNSGTTLPETGGVGTTMFYVIGAILMVGAAVVMITRKRMSR